MNSPWLNQVLAVLGKELKTEVRSSHGLATGILLGVLIIASLGYSSLFDSPSPWGAAGMTVSALLFASALMVPRLFLVEEEQGTLDLLRLNGDPSAVFMGKLVAGTVQLLVVGSVLGIVLIELLSQNVERPLYLAVGIAGHIICLAGGFSFSGALVMGASNRWVLAAAAGVPLLLPQSIMAVLVIAYGLGAGGSSSANGSAYGLGFMALVLICMGSLIIPLVWRLSTSASSRTGKN